MPLPIALPLAHFLSSRVGGSRWWWFAVAGLVSFPAAMWTVRALLGVFVLAATRTTLGMLLLSLCSMLGAIGYYWLYSLLNRRGAANV